MPIKITGWRIAVVLVLGGLIAGGVYMIQNEAARAAVAERTTEWLSQIQESTEQARQRERQHYERIQELEQARDEARQAAEGVTIDTDNDWLSQPLPDSVANRLRDNGTKGGEADGSADPRAAE